MEYNTCSVCNKKFYTMMAKEDEAVAVSKIIEAIRPLGVTFDTAISLMEASKEQLKEMATFLPLGRE